MTGGTGDAAEMLARLGLGGDFGNATSELGNLARSLALTKEAHFYPLLFYFRFEEPLYSASRVTFVLLDLTTLIDTALDQQKYSALIRSAPVASLRRCAQLLLKTLDRHFPTVDENQTDAETASFDRSYAAALHVLRCGSIKTQPNAARYADQRGEWESLVRRVGPALGYGMDEIDCRRSRKEAAAFH
ncbi:hypothetical protein ACSV5G_21325 [Agrobacterium cavarae]|uniref:hypothetical protein n=1 Tax=Agrobacterium cavarae TaxID=2528239 RepID=UPI003FD232BF